MRLFCELFLVAVLIWLGWTKSFHDRIDQMRGIEPAAAAQQTPSQGYWIDGRGVRHYGNTPPPAPTPATSP